MLFHGPRVTRRNKKNVTPSVLGTGGRFFFYLSRKWKWYRDRTNWHKTKKFAWWRGRESGQLTQQETPRLHHTSWWLTNQRWPLSGKKNALTANSNFDMIWRNRPAVRLRRDDVNQWNCIALLEAILSATNLIIYFAVQICLCRKIPIKTVLTTCSSRTWLLRRLWHVLGQLKLILWFKCAVAGVYERRQRDRRQVYICVDTVKGIGQ